MKAQLKFLFVDIFSVGVNLQIRKSDPKIRSFFHPFQVSRFFKWIVCQTTSYDKTSMTTKFQIEVGISYKDTGGDMVSYLLSTLQRTLG